MSDKHKDERTEQQIELDKIQVERERFDLDQWKERAPSELIANRISYVSEEQQIFRRNLDSLSALRKSLTGENKNQTLLDEVDKKLSTFVGSLVVTTITAQLLENLSSITDGATSK